MTSRPISLTPIVTHFRPLAAPTGLAQTPRAGAAAKATAGAHNPAAAAQAAQEMEGLFLKLLWQEMWRTISPGEGSFLPKGLAGDIYRDFLTEAYAGRMAEAGGIGLSRMILSHLDR